MLGERVFGGWRRCKEGWTESGEHLQEGFMGSVETVCNNLKVVLVAFGEEIFWRFFKTLFKTLYGALYFSKKKIPSPEKLANL